MVNLDPAIVLVRPACGVCANAPATWLAAVHGAAAYLCDGCHAALRCEDSAVLREAAGEVRLLRTVDVSKYLRTAPFKFARTVPEHPHEYLLLAKSPDLWTHLRVIRFIRERGNPGRWMGTVYAYWRGGDGWEYWASPPASSAPGWRAPATAPTIINRRRWTPTPEDEPT